MEAKYIAAIVVAAIIAYCVGSFESYMVNAAGYVIKGLGCEDMPTKPGGITCNNVKSVSLGMLAIPPLVSSCSVFVGVVKKL